MLVHHTVPVAAELDMLVPAPKKRGSPERTVQVSVVAWLQKVLPAGSMVAAVKNEHKPRSTTPRARARFHQARKQEGVRAGFPDLICVIPGGRCLFLEMKAARGQLSEAQRLCHHDLRAAGHIVGTAKSIEDAHLVLRQAGVPLRGRT